MKTFSERNNLVNVTSIIQIDDINDALRQSLWNVLHEEIKRSEDRYWNKSLEFFSYHYFKCPIHTLPTSIPSRKRWLYDKFIALEWYKVYDLFEVLINNYDDFSIKNDRDILVENINTVLEREVSGYRLINNSFIRITNDSEIEIINEAIQDTDNDALLGANKHLNSALKLFSLKPKPDYRNSIKESISAIESIVKILSNDNSGKFQRSLVELKERIRMHGALSSAFEKLYGYTSDDDGIRHAMINDATVGFSEAKYMLISCSAFIHYIIVKADEAGITKEKYEC